MFSVGVYRAGFRVERLGCEILGLRRFRGIGLFF